MLEVSEMVSAFNMSIGNAHRAQDTGYGTISLSNVDGNNVILSLTDMTKDNREYMRCFRVDILVNKEIVRLGYVIENCRIDEIKRRFWHGKAPVTFHSKNGKKYRFRLLTIGQILLREFSVRIYLTQESV